MPEPQFPDLISGDKSLSAPPRAGGNQDLERLFGNWSAGPRRGRGRLQEFLLRRGRPLLSTPSRHCPRSRLNGHFRNTNNFRNKVTKPPKGALKGRMPGGALLWCGPRPRPNPAFIFTDGRGGSAPGLPAPQEAD